MRPLRNHADEVPLRRSAVLSFRRRPKAGAIADLEGDISDDAEGRAAPDVEELLNSLAAAEESLLTLVDANAPEPPAHDDSASIGLAALSGGLGRGVGTRAARWMDAQIRVLIDHIRQLASTQSPPPPGKHISVTLADLARATASAIDGFSGIVDAAETRGVVQCTPATRESEALVHLLSDELPEGNEFTCEYESTEMLPC
jgi:hypothetical protein